MTQKLFKVGSSAAVTIPKKSLKELGLKIGDHIHVYVDVVNRRVIVSKYKERLSEISKEDIEILRWTRKFIQVYSKDLKALAKK